jgi:MFS family permease
MSFLQSPSESARGRFGRYLHTTFASLKIRNYRLYFIGQGISLVGTWMQGIAQSWLVLTLTKSGTALGLVLAAQFLPVLFLAPYGGVIADRFPKRRILFGSQSLAAILAIAMWALVVTGSIRLWMVYVLALGLGLVNAIDNPTRQSFIHELVGKDDIRNAVTLNSLEVNLTRVLGPALAGVLIASIDLPLCFLLNGLSFVAVLICIWLMRSSELYRSTLIPAEKGQLRQGFAYVRRNEVIRDALLMMLLVGTLTYEFPVTLGMLSKFTFHANADSYALLTCAMGLGAVLGGLFTAGRREAALRALTLASFGFGVTMLLAAVSPTLALAAVAMIAVGAFSVAFTSLTNTILQLEAEPEMRGRVMALWSVAFLGSTPVGAPIVGWIGERFDPRMSMVVGAVAALVAGAVGISAMRARRGAVVGGPVIVEQPAVAEKEDYA